MLESDIRKLTIEVAENNILLDKHNALLERLLEGESGPVSKPAHTPDTQAPLAQDPKALAQESLDKIADQKRKMPEMPKETKAPGTPKTLEDLDKAVQAMVKKEPGGKGVAKVRDLMTQQFQITRLRDLDPAQYGAFLSYLEVMFQ